jgi:hypothetical protein
MEIRGFLSSTSVDTRLVLLGIGIGIGFVLPQLGSLFRRRRLTGKWLQHVDENEIQVCLYSTEHLKSLGRVEKRTIQLEDVSVFFGGNEVIVEKVLHAALATDDENPFVARFLSQEDRWHIMNICLNRISSIFGPFHMFFNEARRCKSCYRSAWYLYTLTSNQNAHRGRFFVTPYKPVLSSVDRGVKRLRVDLVSEQEMREISSGTICPPEWGFFNNRHKQRWELLRKMSELFENQLVIIESCDNNDEEDELSQHGDESPITPSSWQPVRVEDDRHYDDVSHNTWSPMKQDLPMRLSRRVSNPGEKARQARRVACRLAHDQHRDTDNCIMRVHIPFPASSENADETTSKDVVLFE